MENRKERISEILHFTFQLLAFKYYVVSSSWMLCWITSLNCVLYLTLRLGQINFLWKQDAPISTPCMHGHCYGSALVSKSATTGTSSLLLLRRV